MILTFTAYCLITKLQQKLRDVYVFRTLNFAAVIKTKEQSKTVLTDMMYQ